MLDRPHTKKKNTIIKVLSVHCTHKFATILWVYIVQILYAYN